MHRQTQDEFDLPYECCTVTGFSSTKGPEGSLPAGNNGTTVIATRSQNITEATSVKTEPSLSSPRELFLKEKKQYDPVT
jgi:S-adenosylmethionine synthetase